MRHVMLGGVTADTGKILIRVEIGAESATGVIAALGVTGRSTILIVGAMAVSPDLLPMSAARVALVARRPRLTSRAFGTPAPGLALAMLLLAGTATLAVQARPVRGSRQVTSSPE